MALSGPLRIKNILVPEAFIQISQFNVTVGMEIIGTAHIFASAEMARNHENHIEQIIVSTVDDLVTNYQEQLYRELMLDDNFSHLTMVPDIFNIVSDRTLRYNLRLPLGRYSPETGFQSFIMENIQADQALEDNHG